MEVLWSSAEGYLVTPVGRYSRLSLEVVVRILVDTVNASSYCQTQPVVQYRKLP
jgi:hypothetical protein